MPTSWTPTSTRLCRASLSPFGTHFWSFSTNCTDSKPQKIESPNFLELSSFSCTHSLGFEECSGSRNLSCKNCPQEYSGTTSRCSRTGFSVKQSEVNSSWSVDFLKGLTSPLNQLKQLLSY
jgi:hypothetical protein